MIAPLVYPFCIACNTRGAGHVSDDEAQLCYCLNAYR